jgi:hypothetical protein
MLAMPIVEPLCYLNCFSRAEGNAKKVALQLSGISTSTFLTAILIAILFDEITATISLAHTPSITPWLIDVCTLLPSVGRLFSRTFIPALFALGIPAKNASFYFL